VRRTLSLIAVCQIAGAVALAITGVLPDARAQNAVQDSAAPALQLTTAQRHTVFQSVSTTQKNNASPTGFRVSVGALVPAGIDLSPMPDTLATLIPSARGFSVAMVEKQVVIVDGKSRQVVAVVTEAQ
jgi:hypothetical protein